VSSRFKRKRSLITDEIDLELVVDWENLNEELMNQPLLMRKWTKLKSEVTAKAKAIKEHQKRLEASVRFELAGDQKLKVKDLDARVLLDEQVIEAQEETIEAERLQEEYEGIVRSFWQRHDTLKELSANRRKEVID